jgi:hypothetical protein
MSKLHDITEGFCILVEIFECDYTAKSAYVPIKSTLYPPCQKRADSAYVTEMNPKIIVGSCRTTVTWTESRVRYATIL